MIPTSGASSRRRRWRALLPQPLEERRLLAADVIAPPPLDSPVLQISAKEQLLAEAINRARANPTAEASRIGIDLNEGLEPDRQLDGSPSPPLAIRQSLSAAARDHSQAMLDHDFFSHTDPRDGSRPSDRAQAAGYPGGAGENLALNYFNPCEGVVDRILAVHEQLFRSPGHRVNLLRPHYRDLGVGLAMGDPTCPPNRFERLLATEKFGSREPWAVTGVAYDDSVIPDDFYSVGEGLAGVTIEAVSSEGQTFRTLTGPSGGYTLDLPPGTYTVTASGGAFEIPVTAEIVIAAANVKQDFRPSAETEPESEPWREFDVNGDGQVTALDALLVINRIVRRMRDGNPPDHEHADLTALHALRIINFIAREATRGGGGGGPGMAAAEGERVAPKKADATISPWADDPAESAIERRLATFSAATASENSPHDRCFSPDEDWHVARFAV